MMVSRLDMSLSKRSTTVLIDPSASVIMAPMATIQIDLSANGKFDKSKGRLELTYQLSETAFVCYCCAFKR